MDLDLKRIEAKISFIQENLGVLQELSTFSEADFKADRIKFYAAIHALQVSIEAMLDTFSHMIARLHLGAPTNDRETLEVALEKGLITKEHFRRFVDMNKFRNKVVHGYLDVDTRKVYHVLQTELNDFGLFFVDVRKVIASEQAKAKTGKKKTNGKK